MLSKQTMGDSPVTSILLKPHCSMPPQLWGIQVNVSPFRAFTGGDFDVSPCRKRGKDRLPLRWWLKQLWDRAKPQRHGLVLPLCSLELKVDFSSFPLSPASPPIPQLLAVPVCTHADNTQNCLLLPWQWNKASHLAFERCPSLLTPGRIPGDLWSAANQSPSHSHFPWHSWNSPTACPLSFSYSARLKLFAPLPPCLSLPFLRPTSLPPAGQTPMALDGRQRTNVSLLSLLTRNPPFVLLQPTGPFQAPSSWANDKLQCQGGGKRKQPLWANHTGIRGEAKCGISNW